MIAKLNIIVMFRTGMAIMVRYFDDYDKALAHYKHYENVITDTMVHCPIVSENIHAFDDEEKMADFLEEMDECAANKLLIYRHKHEIFQLDDLAMYTLGDTSRKYFVKLNVTYPNDEEIYAYAF